jgi:hypothetical protein
MGKVEWGDVGKPCVYVDPRGKHYAALITAVHGGECINLVYVNDAEGQKDNYGQKVMRSSSCMHGNIQQAHGNYWLLPGEERVPPKYKDMSSVVVSE